MLLLALMLVFLDVVVTGGGSRSPFVSFFTQSSLASTAILRSSASPVRCPAPSPDFPFGPKNEVEEEDADDPDGMPVVVTTAGSEPYESAAIWL